MEVQPTAVWDWGLPVKVNKSPCVYLPHTHLHLCSCALVSVDVSLASLLWAVDWISSCVPTAFGLSKSLIFQCEQPNAYPTYSSSSTQQTPPSPQNKPSLMPFFVSLFSVSFQYLDKAHGYSSTWHCPLLPIFSHPCFNVLMLFLQFFLITLPLSLSLSYTHREQCQILHQNTLSLLWCLSWSPLPTCKSD